MPLICNRRCSTVIGFKKHKTQISVNLIKLTYFHHYLEIIAGVLVRITHRLSHPNGVIFAAAQEMFDLVFRRISSEPKGDGKL